ncbi:molybdopterin guanine dinucleotide synthesis [Tateyamaria sp. SN6-1]|uniref:molybdopterin guanine dinucleotide synthesis n=1 Tax=Tateyamaria sp. SN6-1 TaxID=3092148 RepID=UPI0039F49397
MSAFDTVIIVDWSGGNQGSVKPKADAIWACVARDGAVAPPVYLRHRQAAESWLAETLTAEQAAGRRVLAGFDFPFGYPEGFATALTGRADPFALWDWFEARVMDSPTGNNRFELAGEINARFGGRGPFWGNAGPRDVDGLPRTKKEYANRFPERRKAETQARGAFTLWQLAGAGAVGSQTIMGLPVLNRLRKRFGGAVAVWPFEPLAPPVSLVEVWPSLMVGPAPDGWIKDQWQVHEVARILAGLPVEDMATMLDVSAPEEGWIFGLGHEAALTARGAHHAQ